MENVIMEEQAERPQRPVFLTVLCILTFIGSGWSVLSDLFSIFTAGWGNSQVYIGQYSEQLENLESGQLPSFMSGFLDSSMQVLQATAEHAREIAIIGLVLSLISLLGAVLMFSLRRLGFPLYAAAQVLALFILPYFAGFSTLVVIGLIWSGVITVVFIVLYALNLKYMK